MDHAQATISFQADGVLLCLDAPSDSTLEFGIDTNSWVTGPQFKGLKLIPVGVHFIFYSIKSKYGGDSAPRTSFFMNFKRGDVVVLRWALQTEQFEILGKEEAEPYVKGVKEYQFDSNLGVYPREDQKKWCTLSAHISPYLVARLQPIGIQIAATGKALTNEERRQLDEAMEEMGVENATREQEIDKLGSEKQCYFTEIPNRVVLPKGSTPEQITALYMDKTPLLDRMIEVSYQNNDIDFLGETQFAFICFLLGQSFEAFEQWKKFVCLALGCESAVYRTDKVTFWIQFLVMLRAQLVEAPEDFFIDIVEGNNFLHQFLCDFFEITSDPSTPEDIQAEVESFHSFVEDRFGVPFDFEHAGAYE